MKLQATLKEECVICGETTGVVGADYDVNTDCNGILAADGIKDFQKLCAGRYRLTVNRLYNPLYPRNVNHGNWQFSGMPWPQPVLVKEHLHLSHLRTDGSMFETHLAGGKYRSENEKPASIAKRVLRPTRRGRRRVRLTELGQGVTPRRS
jgi:hypothetical protein